MKPKGTGWRKCPSVTAGGKPFFWYRRIGDRSEWYLWNRVTHTWEYRS